MLNSLPDYKNLDLSGEARSAAERMEARALEPASEAMFRELVAPLLAPGVRRVLDIGCGTGSLARRIARLAPDAEVVATDKSTGMLQVGELLAKSEGLSRVKFLPWDVMDEAAFPGGPGAFDLIVSSVMIIYLSEDDAENLIGRLARRLSPGGVLAFVEQDLMTDTIGEPSELFLRVLAKDKRSFKRSQALGLRLILRNAGLELLPRASFLWSDENYGAYTRELLERFADSCRQGGGISADEADAFKKALDEQAARGDFYYGLVYHRIAARK
jgi:SAM-dependent methyltransferase